MNIRDVMANKLGPVYGPSNSLADWENQFWLAQGFTHRGPGDKRAWYLSQGATGFHFGDVERDYWTNVYGGGGGVAPANTVAPLLSGTSFTDAGQVVSTGNGTWTGTPAPTFTYQWQRSATGVGGWANLVGQTASSYTTTLSDTGQFLRCVVTGTNASGSASANSNTASVVSAGLALLQSATLWLDASDVTAGSQWLRNKGTGGRSLDARFGSVGQAQVVGGALKLPGANGNWASTPNAAPLNVTGDLDISVHVAMIDWTPPAAGVSTFVGKRGGGASNFGYQFRLDNASGVLQLSYGNTPTTVFGASSTVAPAVTDGTPLWVRVTRNSTTGIIRFFTAPSSTAEPSSWTQLGADIAGPTGAGAVSSDPLGIGDWASATSEFLNGTIFRAVIKNGIGGTVVFDANFAGVSNLAGTFTESSANAATVTINSTSGADTNDPLLLTHTGTNYLYLPGSTGNFGSSTVSLSPASWDIACHVNLNAYSGITSAPWGVNVLTVSGGTRPVSLNVSANTDRLGMTLGGIADFTSSVAHSLAANTSYWIRCVYDSVAGVVQFYTAPTTADNSIPSTWTQLGANVGTSAGIAFGTSTTVNIGPNAAGFISGAVFRCVIRNSPGGTIIFDSNFATNTNQSSFTESSPNAATVTINRAASGRKAVMVVRPTLLFGTDDFLEVSDNNLLDFGGAESLTVIAVGRQFPNGTNFGSWVSKKQGAAAAGYFLGNNGSTVNPQFSVADGTANPAANGPTYTAGQYRQFVGVRDVVADQVIGYLGATAGTPTTDSTTATLAQANSLFVGRSPGATPLYIDGEVTHVAVFRSALNATQLGQIATYLGA